MPEKALPAQIKKDPAKAGARRGSFAGCGLGLDTLFLDTRFCAKLRSPAAATTGRGKAMNAHARIKAEHPEW
jgi:hypothetical protein